MRSWLYPTQAAALGRLGPASHLGSTLEVTLSEGVLKSWPRAEELTRAHTPPPTPHVPCGGMDEGKISLLPLAAWGMKAVKLGSKT